MRYVAWLFWLLIVLVTTMFASINSHPVLVQYYFGHATVLLPFLLLTAMGVGVLLGWLVLAPVWLKMAGKNRMLQQKINTKEQEVNNLRNIPIKDAH